MAESVVFVAAHHIHSMIKDKHNRLSDVEDELQSLQSDLMEIKDWLVDAQKNKELSHNEEVRAWLADLTRIAYKSEDVIDTWVLESARLFRLPRMNKASKQLRKLKGWLEMVKSKLDQNVNELKGSPRASMIPRAHGQQPDEDFVVGIDKHVHSLVEQLVRQSSSDQPWFDVLAIVGMGGSGKTTLARKIYSHGMVKRHFHSQAWITLSPHWNTLAVMLEILRQVSGVNNVETELNDLNVLKTVLKDVLNGRRCLVVLDDVWDSDPMNEVLTMLDQKSEVSIGVDKVILTSRNRALSLPNGSLKWIYHETKCLGESESWDLFAKIACKSRGGLPREYEHALGKEMLKKCQGLPLAIVALATLLNTKDTIQEWERVFSQIEGTEGPSMYRPVNDILALSFDMLPYYLKPCFLYLALFPQGSSISVGMLIRMWIAEGFVTKYENGNKLEDGARRFLQELVDLSLVQVENKNYAGKVTTVRVHDIVRELCIMKAQELDFLSVFPSKPEITRTEARRAATNLGTRLSLPMQNPYLRSVVLSGMSSTPSSRVDDYTNPYLRNHAMLNLVVVCDNFKLLRVLDLSGIKTSEGTLPSQIGRLVHLRYLRMRSTNIKEIPKSISKLRNLLTLDYWDVYSGGEVTIPNVLWKLKHLRHLYLPNGISTGNRELKFHTNTDLQTLWGVKGGDWMKKEMDNLGSSLKKLYVHGISSHDQIEALFKSPLIKTGKNLNSLALDWYDLELESLDALCSNHSLRKLRLMGRVSDKSNAINFPDNLQKLELYHTRFEKQETMTVLGRLHSLKFLRLSKDSYIGTEWICCEGTFPQLQELRLCNVPLQHWKMGKGSMLHLSKLSVVSCPRLIKLPDELKSVHALEQLEIERMPSSFFFPISQTPDDIITETQSAENFHITRKVSEDKIRNFLTSLSQPNVGKKRLRTKVIIRILLWIGLLSLAGLLTKINIG